MFADVSNAHLYAPMVDEELVEFPKCANDLHTVRDAC